MLFGVGGCFLRTDTWACVCDQYCIVLILCFGVGESSGNDELFLGTSSESETKFYGPPAKFYETNSKRCAKWCAYESYFWKSR